MKKYIKPSIKVKRIELGNSILAGSIGVGISDDPATGPALSKGSFFSDDKEWQQRPFLVLAVGGLRLSYFHRERVQQRGTRSPKIENLMRRWA